MDFFEAVKKRRSIRKYTEEKVPDSVIEKALEAAILAPNSSNVQTWDFYWVQSPEKKQKLVQYCLNQWGARTAQHLVVVVADPKLWKRSTKRIAEYAKSINAPKSVILYYNKLIPITYTWGLFNILAPIKWLMYNVGGLFRPMPRGPYGRGGLQEVAIKSAALAAENFMLAISAQGYDSLPMEGHDEMRVKCLLKLGCSARVAMVIAVGKSDERGTWGPQFRLPLSEVVHKI